jgi:hypothetical protein
MNNKITKAGFGLLTLGALGALLVTAPVASQARSHQSQTTSSTTSASSTSSTSGTTTKAKTAHTVRGTVVSVDGTTLTVQPTAKKGSTTPEQQQFTVPATAKIIVNGKTGALSTIQTGQRVTVKVQNDEVKRVIASPAPKK